MISIKAETTNGKEIEISNIPQSILEYAEYYAEFEAHGMTPMNFEDWKRVEAARSQEVKEIAKEAWAGWNGNRVNID